MGSGWIIGVVCWEGGRLGGVDRGRGLCIGGILVSFSFLLSSGVDEKTKARKVQTKQEKLRSRIVLVCVCVYVNVLLYFFGNGYRANYEAYVYVYIYNNTHI